MKRRLAAILAADLVGYSRLIRADEEGTLAALQTLRRDALDPIIAQHFYGLELREVREVFGDLARQGHPPPAELNGILIPGGRA